MIEIKKDNLTRTKLEIADMFSKMRSPEEYKEAEEGYFTFKVNPDSFGSANGNLFVMLTTSANIKNYSILNYQHSEKNGITIPIHPHNIDSVIDFIEKEDSPEITFFVMREANGDCTITGISLKEGEELIFENLEDSQSLSEDNEINVNGSSVDFSIIQDYINGTNISSETFILKDENGDYYLLDDYISTMYRRKSNPWSY